MGHDEIKMMVVSIAPVIRGFVSEALSPLTARLDTIESRFAAMPVPRDGTSVTLDDVSPLILAEVSKAMGTIPEPVSVDDVAAVVVERMTVDFQKVHEILEVLQEPSDPPELPDIPALVQEAVAALPKPQDGRSVTADELRPLVAEAVSAAVSTLPVPKDGADVTDLLIDRDGALVATLSNGRTKALGKIVGRDGTDGANADPNEIAGLKSQLDGALAEIAELREAVPASEISDEEFQRRVELATSQEAVSMRAKAIRQSNGEARSLQVMREAIVGAMKDTKQPVVNVTVPITMPKRGKEITTVKQHDENGRILQFEKQEVDD